VRSDENFKTVRGVENSLGDFGAESPKNSFSGGERDNLFLSDRGEQFYDIAGLAGLDDPGDGRTSSQLDFDRDGWTDLVVASATVPTLKLYRNRIGEELYGESKGARMVAIRLQGGNQAAAADRTWSPRDGWGAILKISYTVDGKPVELLREYRCGDGRAAQNSKTLLVGVGAATSVDIAVRWPSGKTQRYAGVRPGALVTGFENPEHNPQERGRDHSLENYLLEATDASRDPLATRSKIELSLPGGDVVPQLHVVTAMSTHCPSCKKAQPQVKMLREAFANEVGVWGVPIDLEENADVLDEYVAKYQPFYDVLITLPMSERLLVKEHITRTFLDEVTPASIITDAEGNVLHTMQGVPTISDVKRFLAR
jgi:hypothetical protein